MDSKIKEVAKVIISDDRMEARLYLSSSPDSSGFPRTDLFTLPNIKELIAESGVKAGIDKPLLQAVITERMYDRYIIFAKGNPAVNGEDGHFTFHFKTQLDNKPKLMPDGSVDYHNIEIYEQVTQGQEIATYTPSTVGHYGYDVFGQMIPTTAGKDLQPLKGEGFTISEDNNHYYADCNGKVELNHEQLIVSNVLDIKGDVDLTTGDIEFNGDVIIHGSVLTGSTINVVGNLTILGNVESAHIMAGGDIELKSGMQGGGKGMVECGGDVWGKFFEQTVLKVKKDLHANSLLNCNTLCEGDIYISGKHGIIVGGNTTCQGNIEATVIGNMAEVKTYIAAGVNNSSLEELNELEGKIKDINESLDKHTQIMDKLKAIENPTEQEKYDTMVAQVESSMKELNIQLTGLKAELDQKLFLISSYSHSKITVHKYLYPQVSILLNGLHYACKDTYTNVVVKDVGGEVQVMFEIS